MQHFSTARCFRYSSALLYSGIRTFFRTFLPCNTIPNAEWRPRNSACYVEKAGIPLVPRTVPRIPARTLGSASDNYCLEVVIVLNFWSLHDCPCTCNLKPEARVLVGQEGAKVPASASPPSPTTDVCTHV